MPRPRPPHLQRHKTRHGKFVWYVRTRHRPLVRIRADYGTPEFEVEYHAALNLPAQPIKRRERTPTGGTLEWLWMMYRQSQTWKRLSPATKKQRENIMSHVLEKAGSEPFSAIDSRAIRNGVNARADTPSQAKNFLQTMRQLFVWAVEHEHVRTNPAESVRVKKPKNGGFPVWTNEDVHKYEKRWPLGTRQRVAFDVFCYTGLRRGDAARLGKQHVKDGVISIKTEKTGTWVHIPILPALARTLEGGPTGDLTFIVTSSGKAYRKESLGNEFKTWCREAGIPDKAAHGLRKVAATRAAENGATVNELMSIFGWTNVQEAELYTKSADRKLLAARAMHKLER